VITQKSLGFFIMKKIKFLRNLFTKPPSIKKKQFVIGTAIYQLEFFLEFTLIGYLSKKIR